MSFVDQYFQESIQLLQSVDTYNLEKLIGSLTKLRNRGGRLFLIGSGGGSAHASHAAADFRKISGIQAYSISDNIASLTAHINDESWEYSYRRVLEESKLNSNDGVLVISVGGGSQAISANIFRAVEYAWSKGCIVLGIIGRDGGYVAKHATSVVIIPPLFPSRVTPHTEGIQSLILHLLVSHPSLAKRLPKWETEQSS